MKCSCCESKLEVTHRDYYTPEYKYTDDGYQCLNTDCVANNFQVVWNSRGTIYYNEVLGISNIVSRRIIQKMSIDNKTSAIDSYERCCEIIYDNEQKKQLTFKFKNVGILIKPNYKIISGGYKSENSIKFNKWKINLTRLDKNTWIYAGNPIKMTKFIVKDFLINYKTHNFDICLQYLDSKDKRFYRIAARLLINIFFSNKVKTINTQKSLRYIP